MIITSIMNGRTNIASGAPEIIKHPNGEITLLIKTNLLRVTMEITLTAEDVNTMVDVMLTPSDKPL